MPEQILTSIITATPFRVSLFGGGTDFPAYFNRRGGLVLATAMRKYSYVALNSLERLMERRFRISYSQLEMVDDVEHIRHDIVRTTLTEYAALVGDGFLDIHSYADLPAGTGIGSSSAFAVGMLGALHALNGLYVPPKDLARRAIRIERELMGEVGGWQDQILSAFGGFNAVRFHDNDFEVFPLVLSMRQRLVIEESCWLYFTATRRSSASVQQVSFSPANIIDKEKVLDQTRELAEEAVRVLRGEPDPHAMLRRWGELLDLSWSLKRSLSGAVSLPDIDVLYEKARAAGAYGGKIIGAGGGGFLLVMGPPERRAAIDQAVGQLRSFPLKLEPSGSHIVYANEKL
ncbi:MAG TPA: kinase [Acetobacteraceae bacterium]|nr:kinase [Acetobacteraceae bacterium]